MEAGMDPLKRRAAIFLGISLAIAVLTPLRIILALPNVSVYHGSPAIFAMQAIPYIVAGAIWLPAKDPGAPVIAYRLSLLLFAAACVIWLPLLVIPRSSGDMVGLGYILVFLATMVTIAVLSVGALIVMKLRR
jgi:hypothetical protein